MENYEVMFKELLDEMKRLYKESMDEQIAMNKEIMEAKKTFTGLQMTHYYKLEGRSEILMMLIGIMADAIRLKDVKDEGIN